MYKQNKIIYKKGRKTTVGNKSNEINKMGIGIGIHKMYIRHLMQAAHKSDF